MVENRLLPLFPPTRGRGRILRLTLLSTLHYANFNRSDRVVIGNHQTENRIIVLFSKKSIRKILLFLLGFMLVALLVIVSWFVGLMLAADVYSSGRVG